MKRTASDIAELIGVTEGQVFETSKKIKKILGEELKKREIVIP